jgi:hypothetical protein
LDIITEKQVQCQRAGSTLDGMVLNAGTGGTDPVWLAVGAAAVAGLGGGGAVAWSRRRAARPGGGR